MSITDRLARQTKNLYIHLKTHSKYTLRVIKIKGIIEKFSLNNYSYEKLTNNFT